jgi:hypothetical protein
MDIIKTEQRGDGLFHHFCLFVARRLNVALAFSSIPTLTPTITHEQLLRAAYDISENINKSSLLRKECICFFLSVLMVAFFVFCFFLFRLWV